MKLRRYAPLVMLLLCATVALAAENTPRAAYETYREALLDGDFETFKQFIPDAQLGEWQGEDAQEKFLDLRQSIPAELKIAGVAESGEKARVLAKCGGTSGEVEMVLEKGAWKVARDEWEGDFARPAPKTPAPPVAERRPAIEPKEKPAAGNDEESVKTAYLNYRKAIMAGDLEELKNHVVEEKIKELGDDAAGTLAMIKGFMPPEVKIKGVSIDRDRATIEVSGKAALGNDAGTVELAIEDNRWKVVSESWRAGEKEEEKRAEPAAVGVSGQIAFIDNRSGQYEVHTINADGSGPKQVTKGGGFKGDLAWSPDAQKFVFSMHDISSDEDLYVVDADGGQVRLTENEAKDCFPTWSPDGLQIAFVSTPRESVEGGGGVYQSPDIYVVNSDGSQLRQLTNSGKVTSDPIAWSPEGDAVAFTSMEDNDWHICTIDVGSGEIKRLVSSDRCSSPAWSPDGERLAFSTWIDFGKPALTVMNKDGSSLKTLHKGDIKHDTIRWSPDGGKILFAMQGAQGAFSDDIYVIDPDGSNLKRLTGTKEQEKHASWSPDSQWIAYVRDFELYIIPADVSGEETKIGAKRGGHDHAVWSPK
ncbi:MAG: hypothetical protein A2Z34_00985 [Planctomycetes bacterium RBG_16_59_8]|nr:MAG: hypothetical protein A2Z34_00985 [Planctomycetes bacterium RBG_16_59_8]